MKKALLLGASGFIGSFLLRKLLDSADYDQVIVVVRKPLDVQNPKLKTLLGDFESLPSLAKELVADDVFIALGTTKDKTPEEAKYYQIDHDYPVAVAKLAKSNGARAVFVVSSVGANVRSKTFYIRTKGEMERDIIALDFPFTQIFRPSLLMGVRKEHRPLEKFMIGVWGVVNPLLAGPLTNYKGIEGCEVAEAMVKAAQQPTAKLKIYHWQEMEALVHLEK